METKVDSDSLHTIAYDNGLDLIETTISSNGYPNKIKPALVGFNSFQDAVDIANKYNMEIQTFFKRDGWALYYRNGNRTYEAIKPKESDFGDNFKSYIGNPYTSFEDFYQQEGEYIRDEIKQYTYNQLQNHLSTLIRIYDEIELHDENDITITDGYQFYNFNIEIMEYSYDTKNYIIGVI